MSEERPKLERLLQKGKVASYKQQHARILLLADQGTSSKSKMSDSAMAEAVNCGTATVERIRKRTRYDYEYKRNGVANLFMMFEPLSGKRQLKVKLPV